MSMTTEMTDLSQQRPASYPTMGGRVGPIGDIPGDAAFLRGAATHLAAQGCRSMWCSGTTRTMT